MNQIELLSRLKVEKKGKGKKDKSEAKALAKAEKELAEAWFYSIEGQFSILATF